MSDSGYSLNEATHLEEGWFFYDHAWMLAFHLMQRFKGGSVLDVGCGTGLALGLYKNCKLNLDFRGCEPNDNARHLWDKRGVAVDVASATKLPYADNEFDTVVSSHVLEHIHEESDAILEMARVAKRRLIVVVPQGNVDEKNHGGKHVRYYNRINIKSSFSVIDWDVEKNFYVLPHHHMDNLVVEVDF